jgi:hypothetical protein
MVKVINMKNISSTLAASTFKSITKRSFKLRDVSSAARVLT